MDERKQYISKEYAQQNFLILLLSTMATMRGEWSTINEHRSEITRLYTAKGIEQKNNAKHPQS